MLLRAALPALERTAVFLQTWHIAIEGSVDANRSPITGVGERSRAMAEHLRNVDDMVAAAVPSSGVALSSHRESRGVHRAIQCRMATAWFYSSAETRSVDKTQEPDEILRPMTTIGREIIKPIIDHLSTDAVLIRPANNGVSMLICGPAGSGKTFLVRELGAALGGPALQLSPGDFIGEGAELIESKARAIFDTLMDLDHVVVFFDECDELFRDRNAHADTARTVLLFVTASMLAKLQALHDDGRVVFVVATNYLDRIDSAIRRAGRFDLRIMIDRSHSGCRASTIDGKVEGTMKRKKLYRTTAGLTMKDVIEFAGDERSEPGNGSREDYMKWCISFGPTELAAAGATASQRLKRSRWNGRRSKGTIRRSRRAAWTASHGRQTSRTHRATRGCEAREGGRRDPAPQVASGDSLQIKLDRKQSRLWNVNRRRAFRFIVLWNKVVRI